MTTPSEIQLQRSILIGSVKDRTAFYTGTTPSGNFTVVLYRPESNQQLQEFMDEDLDDLIATIDPYIVMIQITDRDGIKWEGDLQIDLNKETHLPEGDVFFDFRPVRTLLVNHLVRWHESYTRNPELQKKITSRINEIRGSQQEAVGLGIRQSIDDFWPELESLDIIRSAVAECQRLQREQIEQGIAPETRPGGRILH